MKTALTGAILGAVLAFAALQFGFWGFFIVALFMGIGALVARIATGELDIREIVGVFTGRRTNS